MVKDILSYGIGTLAAFLLLGALLFLFIHDVTQKKHSVLRNYPVIGRLRYFFEQHGRVLPAVFLRRRPRRDAVQPRHARLGLPPGEERGRHHRLRLDLRPARARRASSSSTIRSRCSRRSGCRRPRSSLGEGYCKQPFEARSIVNISGMSFGAISAARGARAVARRGGGRLLDGHRRGRPLALPPRGRLRRHHADRHRQVRHARRAGQPLAGAAASSCPRRSRPSRSSSRRARSRARAACCPARKVTAEIAQIRGIPEGQRLDQPQPPSRHRQHERAAGQDRLDPRAHRAPGGRQDRDRRLAVHERDGRHRAPARPGVRARLPRHRRRRGRLAARRRRRSPTTWACRSRKRCRASSMR